MKIKEINIKNFRCFEALTVSFHENITVLTATNGGGKTTILDAIRISLWPYVKGFDLGSQTGKSATIQIDDVRIKRVGSSMEPQINSSIEALGDWPELFDGNPTISWLQYRESIKPNTNTKYDINAKSIPIIASKLQDMVRNDSPAENGSEISLSLAAYLGTGRLWYQGRHTSEVDDSDLDISTHSRTWGYKNCITATSSYKQFEEWFGWIFKSYRELQIEELEGKEVDQKFLESFKSAIDVVQGAINLLTEQETGWRDLQYRSSQNQQLVMEHNDHGYVPLSQLSDGLRNMVVMISDIAFRCYKLNPHLGNKAALETEGVVLIDEVDMFLHPSWQQRVISSLRQAFPKIQFIVTTHSPQVLSTVPKECIRVLGTNAEGENIAATPLASSYGEPSNDVLQAIMHVDPQPPVPEKRLLDELTSLVDQGEYQSKHATELLAELKQKLNDQHPQILKIERSIRRQEAFKA
jgi:predicted ATP-binding protein involved in virulence